jgi:hypothetical protein
MHFFEDDVQRLASFAFALCVGLIPIASDRAAAEGPGSIIRVWPLEGGGPSGVGSTAFRILYRSTGLNGSRSKSRAPSSSRLARRRRRDAT